MEEMEKLVSELKKLGNPKKAKASSWFFKTGKGQYGEGDVFLGVTVPEQRKIAKNFFSLSISEIQKLLDSEIHEARLTGLLILVSQYKKTDDRNKKKIVNFYLKNSKKINNWDLVDSSAPYILGDYLLKNNRGILYKYVRSKNLWQRRISIVSTMALISKGHFDDTLRVSTLLLTDKEDLIHKAVGWMLREVGKKSENTLENFLLENVSIMPRTTLRYAIERFSEQDRKKFLNM
ncbi:MAG: DNA alkylation repair protein [Minisyncoccia bacterium]